MDGDGGLTRGGGAMQLRLSGYQGLRTSMDNKSYD